jgi:hypothetical protein
LPLEPLRQPWTVVCPELVGVPWAFSPACEVGVAELGLLGLVVEFWSGVVEGLA